MGISVRRKNRKVAKHSNYMNIPHPLKVGQESTIAADRLLLADPRGEIDADFLLELLEKYLEPEFWKRVSNREKSVGEIIPKRG